MLETEMVKVHFFKYGLCQKKKDKHTLHLVWAIILFPLQISAKWFMSKEKRRFRESF